MSEPSGLRAFEQDAEISPSTFANVNALASESVPLTTTTAKRKAYRVRSRPSLSPRDH